MTEETQQLLENLHLKKMATILTRSWKMPRTTRPPTASSFSDCLQAQWHERQEKCLQYRIQQARLPEQWTLESFSFQEAAGRLAPPDPGNLPNWSSFLVPRISSSSAQPGWERRDFASGLLLKALQNGFAACLSKRKTLLDEMYASLADRSSRKLIKRLARVDALLIDELGYVNVRPEQTNIFFKLMEERYGRKATILTTNLDYNQWHNILANKIWSTAMLSRLHTAATRSVSKDLR